MKKSMLIVSMSLLASVASAQNDTTAAIALPDKLHNMWLDEFQEIKGTYYLSNGKKMQISLSGDRMYATIDGVERTRLVAASPYVFIGRDQKMKISVNNPEGNAPMTAEILMAVSTDTAGTKLERLVASR